MKLISAMLVVKDINQSVDFYETVLGLKIISDFGANKTLSGGLALQTLDSYKQFIETDNIRFGGNNSEIYFEVDDFDEFAEKIKKLEIEYVHPVKEHGWGQRVVRFYDLDGHLVEVGEDMGMVVRRFLRSGMTMEEVSDRMDVSMGDLEKLLERDTDGHS